MALLDFILDRTGAIGAKIHGYRLVAGRDSVITQRPRSPRHTTIITSDYKVLAFDAATDIKHEFSSKVTSYSVEDRSEVSDHIINSNPTFSVTGVFSDASAPSLPNKTTPSVTKLLDKTSTGRNGRPHHYTQSETYRLLLKIRDDRKTVTLITPLDTYSDLVLTNLSIPRTTGQGDALFVDMTFEKIRRVSNELTTVFVGESKSSKKTVKTSGDTAVSSKKEVEAGNKPPVPADVPAKKKWEDRAVNALEVIGVIGDDSNEKLDAWLKKGGH